MHLTRLHRFVILLPGIVAACHDGPTPPNSGIAVGESFAVTGAQSVKL